MSSVNATINTIEEVTCGFPLTPDCTDILNWAALLFAGIAAFVIFLWQWNIRAHRRDAGQAKMILHLMVLKETLQEHEKALNDFFDNKISVKELAKDKEKRIQYVNQLKSAVSLFHDSMNSNISITIEDIIDYAMWNTVDNREVELEHNAFVISKIDELLDTEFKRRSKYVRTLLDEKIKERGKTKSENNSSSQDKTQQDSEQ